MKTLQEVVAKRKEVQEQLDIYKYQKSEIERMHGTRISQMHPDIRSDYGYIASVCMKLKLQIDTLTYVINYDSELPDVTHRYGQVSKGGI